MEKQGWFREKKCGRENIKQDEMRLKEREAEEHKQERRSRKRRWEEPVWTLLIWLISVTFGHLFPTSHHFLLLHCRNVTSRKWWNVSEPDDLLRHVIQPSSTLWSVWGVSAVQRRSAAASTISRTSSKKSFRGKINNSKKIENYRQICGLNVRNVEFWDKCQNSF